MNYQMLRYERSGKTATISFSRPEKFNTIKPPMPEEMHHALSVANHDPEVSVIVLEGDGDSFCAGFDFSITQGAQWWISHCHGSADPGANPKELHN